MATKIARCEKPHPHRLHVDDHVERGRPLAVEADDAEQALELFLQALGAGARGRRRPGGHGGGVGLLTVSEESCCADAVHRSVCARCARGYKAGAAVVLSGAGVSHEDCEEGSMAVKRWGGYREHGNTSSSPPTARPAA